MDLIKATWKHLLRDEPKSIEDIKRTGHKNFECYKFKGLYVVRLEDDLYYPVLGSPSSYQVTAYNERPFTGLFDAMLWNVQRSNDNLKSSNVEII